MNEMTCRLIETGLCYDQLNGSALARAEIAARQTQLVEKRHRNKVIGKADETAAAQESYLFTGNTTRGGLCIWPKLQEWVADELCKESEAMKERRTAREERSPAKPR